MRGTREEQLASALGPIGVWDAGLCYASADTARRNARQLEDAGYTAAWLHEGGRDAFVGAALLLSATHRMTVGTSIVSIWRHEPGQMAAAARSLGEAFPGRFVLGVGNAHQGAVSWHGRGYGRPVGDMSEYLDAMDGADWGGRRPDPPVPRMIAALGPQMLGLARRRARGVIPYLVPVEHTRFAREALGPEPILAVHQAVVVGEPVKRARALVREHIAPYLTLPNYYNNFARFGFGRSALVDGGSDDLIDALVAIGDVGDIAARVREHLDAGADHVCVNPLPHALDAVPVDQLRRIPAAINHGVAA